MSYRLPKKNELLFCPLSGTREIGKNLNLYGTHGKWLMIDCGIKFSNHIFSNQNILLPNISSVNLIQKDIIALILTHAHEDHIGALPYMEPMPFPIYTTPFTYSCLKKKLGKNFHRWIIHKIQSKYLNLKPFLLEWIHLTHSTLESEGLVIRTDMGNIFHTGDWKLDDNPIIENSYDKQAIQSLAQDNLLAVVSDSTNALSAGLSKSEELVAKTLMQLISQINGRIIVTCFASNIARLYSIIKAAQTTERCIGIVGSSIKRMITCAKESNYLKDIPSFSSIQQLVKKPLSKQLIICTGSQGEKHAALNSLLDLKHKNLSLTKDDTVIFSSRIIPGNEFDVFTLQDKILNIGAKIITPSDIPDLHASGHATSEELYQMYSWTKPKIAIPVHGELKHMQAHAIIAEMAGIKNTILLKNGECFSLTKQKIEFCLDSEDFLLDGNRLIDIKTPYIQARKKISEEGALFISLKLNNNNTSILDKRISFNLIFQENDLILKKLDYFIDDKLKDFFIDPKKDLEEYIQNCVQSFLREKIKKNPTIYVHVM